ncbi:ABC transporter substrate-binding protein [Achromobacter sp. DMS1]|uniref:ABC transporter substrate-binding protein n=1 Tax=Achromobacter sp. DMS1 TaxID=1688405 RepID=UPI00069CEEA8|nr:ABC transporter substrate-binding protein [Achromobacter sp. DMS1]KOF54153.1 ABC transporter substrate-binding protein [Achromobacter sp. DMS1]
MKPLSRLAALAAVALVAVSGASRAEALNPPVKVRYEEVVRSILYVPKYVALSQGYFKDAGLDVSMKTSQGTDKGMTALLSGSADIVLIGPEASIYVQNSESPVKPKIFAGLTATDGFFLLSRKPMEKFDWSMLKGKEIIGFRPGSNPIVFLETALRKHGVDPQKDVKLLNNIGIPARAGAWMAGQGEYGIFLEPEAGELVRNGKGYIVASIGHEVGPVDYTVFTATDKYIRDNPKVIQAWTDAVARAEKYVNDTPADKLAPQIMSFFPGMDEKAVAEAIERYKKYQIWKSTPLVTAQAINQLQDMLVASSVMKDSARVKYEDVVVPDFARKVQ